MEILRFYLVGFYPCMHTLYAILGFADSTGWPSSEGLVDDGEYAYKWAKHASKGSSVYLYGHSLGTG